MELGPRPMDRQDLPDMIEGERLRISTRRLSVGMMPNIFREQAAEADRYKGQP